MVRLDEVVNLDAPLLPFFILGETIGHGVQDLTYDTALDFRVFAIAYGYRGQQKFLRWGRVVGPYKEEFGFETVPMLYQGPFFKEVMHRYTTGRTAMGANHMREGIVMVPAVERTAICSPRLDARF